MAFHVNPVSGPARCTTPDSDTCSGWAHFENKYEAFNSFTSDLEARSKHFAQLRAKELKARRKGFTPELVKLDDSMRGIVYDTVVEYPHQSIESYNRMETLVEKRSALTPTAYLRLLDMDPKLRPDISDPAYKVLKYDWNVFRDITAVMVEGLLTSPFYSPKTADYDLNLPVGEAVPASNFAHNDNDWYFSRFNTVGGSDVGALANFDFTENPGSLVKLNLRKVEESKTIAPTAESAQKQMDLSEKSRSGNLYRGTVWEDRIRDQFAVDHPELVTYKTKGQYTGSKYDWQRVNFDGVISDRADGQPTGILEIKTGGVPEKWNKGIPLDYRAQTLYYLNATGLKDAYVRVLINDGEVREFHLLRNDPIAPGSTKPGADQTMQEYLDNRVKPWFEGLLASRTN